MPPRSMLLVAVVLLGGCTSVAAPTSDLDTRPTATARPTPTLPPGAAQLLDLDEPVWGIASAGDTLWVEGDSALHQLDGGTGEVLQELHGFWPRVVGDTLWYQRDDEIVAANAATGAEIAAYRPPTLRGTTVEDGVLWVAGEDGILTSVDLETNQVLSEIKLPEGEPKWVEPWADAIWVVIDGSDVVVRVDPATGEIIGETEAGRRPHSVAVGFGSLWVTEHGDTELLRLDSRGRVQAKIRGPGINVAIAITDDAVWAASPGGVMEIDPSTNEVLREIKLGSGDFYALAVSHESLWLTTGPSGKVFQIPAS